MDAPFLQDTYTRTVVPIYPYLAFNKTTKAFFLNYNVQKISFSSQLLNDFFFRSKLFLSDSSKVHLRIWKNYEFLYSSIPQTLEMLTYKNWKKPSLFWFAIFWRSFSWEKNYIWLRTLSKVQNILSKNLHSH